MLLSLGLSVVFIALMIISNKKKIIIIILTANIDEVGFRAPQILSQKSWFMDVRTDLKIS